jgi:DNA polymerase I
VSAAEDALRERGYRRAWVVDTEYRSVGGLPQARCLCALDLLSGERREVWLAGVPKPPCPFAMTADECFIFFAADADVGVFIALGWTVPRHVIDVRIEFMRICNGLAPLPPLESGDLDIAAEKEAKASKRRHKKPGLFSLSRVTRHYKVPFIEDEAKGDFRDLAMRPGDEYTDVEKRAMIGYCRGDVDATAEVCRRVWDEAGLSDPRTLNQALIRGFYMSAAAWVKRVGIPVDLPLYRRFSMNAGALRSAFIAKHAASFDVYDQGHFSFAKYESFIERGGLLGVWPRTAKGRLAISGKTLGRLADTYRVVEDLLAFLSTVDLLEGIGSSFNAAGELEEEEDEVGGLLLGADSRNHAHLFPFGAKTSRNTPRGRAFMFTNPAWMRFLIRTGEGRAIAYLDWSAQELRIAAALSGDPALQALCKHDDPYIELAIAAGLAPPGATKKTHPSARKIGKVLMLAMLYGAGPGLFVAKANMSRAQAIALLRRQRANFPVFYAWSDTHAYRGLCAAPLWSPLGWRFWPQYWKDNEPPDRTCRNFPVQSAGADVMRVTTIRAFEARIAICAIIHDAFLVEDSDSGIEQTAKVMEEIMTQATEDIVGVSIPVESHIMRHGDDWYDKDERDDFDLLMGMLEEIEQSRKVA